MGRDFGKLAPEGQGHSRSYPGSGEGTTAVGGSRGTHCTRPASPAAWAGKSPRRGALPGSHPVQCADDKRGWGCLGHSSSPWGAEITMPQSKGSLERVRSTVEREDLPEWPLKLRARTFPYKVAYDEPCVVGLCLLLCSGDNGELFHFEKHPNLIKKNHVGTRGAGPFITNTLFRG